MCDLCRNYPCHYMCPNYVPPKTKYQCDICNEGIQNGEEYIKNDYGEYAHWECIDYGRDLAKWLGYEVKEMNED